MLTNGHLHVGRPVAPHDLWTSWSFDPLLMAGLAVALWAHARGAASLGDNRRAEAFRWGVAVVAVALVSPLDGMSGSLASAHMAQHMMLTMVAAPLLAWSRPVATMLAGSSRRLRKHSGRWRRRIGLTPSRLRNLRHPVAVWGLYAGVMWLWHSSILYGAALRHEPVHILEHGSFLVAATLFWSVVLEGFWVRQKSKGVGVFLLFTMALQGVLLAALMTFASSPWYSQYVASAPLWGISPLEDQQLAGLIMWIPAGLIYTGVALALLASWIADTESRPAPASSPLE